MWRGCELELVQAIIPRLGNLRGAHSGGETTARRPNRARGLLEGIGSSSGDVHRKGALSETQMPVVELLCVHQNRRSGDCAPSATRGELAVPSNASGSTARKCGSSQLRSGQAGRLAGQDRQAQLSHNQHLTAHDTRDAPDAKSRGCTSRRVSQSRPNRPNLGSRPSPPLPSTPLR